LTSKTSISRRSSPGSAAPFKGSRPDRLVFMLSTLSTSQAAKRGAQGNNISLTSKCSGCGRPLGQVFSPIPKSPAIGAVRPRWIARPLATRRDLFPRPQRFGPRFRMADNAREATLRHLPKMHCTGSAGE
jgi:hypothetical protein